MFFPLNYVKHTSSDQSVTKHTTPHIHRKSLESGLHMSHVDYGGTIYAHFVIIYAVPGKRRLISE